MPISGFGNPGGAWTVLPDGVSSPTVLPGVSGFKRVCTYDRPGTLLDAPPPDDQSRSDPVLQPTTANAMVADLHTLLTAADVPLASCCAPSGQIARGPPLTTLQRRAEEAVS